MKHRALFPIILALLSLSLSSQAQDKVDLTPVQKWIESQSKLDSLYGTFVQERKMRTLRNPITKEGKFWYRSPSNVRWEMGANPPERIAIKNDAEVLILQPKKGKMERHPIAKLKEDEELKGLTFLEAGFPRTVQEFQRSFQVQKISLEEDYYVVECKIRDNKASLAVTQMVFYIYAKDYQMKAFRLYFRDRSMIYNRFTHLTKNAPIPEGTFNPDTSAYTAD